MKQEYKNPFLTVDIIVEIENMPESVVLIERKNVPHGWAMPGGFVEYGETLEEAAIREVREETKLDVTLVRQFHAYSDPKRDPRYHTISVVFLAKAKGKPEGSDDAERAEIFFRNNLPSPIVFDHMQILDDYFNKRY